VPKKAAPASDWSEVKEKNVEKTEKRDAHIYKVAPSRPTAKPKPAAVEKQPTKPEPPVLQGSAIPGSAFTMPMPVNFVPSHQPKLAAMPVQSKQKTNNQPPPKVEKPVDTSKMSLEEVFKKVEQNG